MDTEKINKNETTYDDIFVKETDTFDIKINYYKEKTTVLIEGIDTDFKIDNPNIKNFTITFRHPNFSDYKKIQQNNMVEQDKDNAVFDFIGLQYSRIEVLFKSWSLEKPEKEIKNLHPKILKAIIQKMNEEISLDGVI